jgi:hypothetical protein
VYSLLWRNNDAKRSTNRIAKLFGIRKQKQTHPIRVIIDATSAADQKTKSRWCRALRYAWHERERWQNFAEFLRLNCGPAGAAAKWSALHLRIPKDGVMTDANLTVQPIVTVEPFYQLYARGGRVFSRPT